MGPLMPLNMVLSTLLLMVSMHGVDDHWTYVLHLLKSHLLSLNLADLYVCVQLGLRQGKSCQI